MHTFTFFSTALPSWTPTVLAAATVATTEPSPTLLLWGVGLFLVAVALFLLEIFIPTGGVLGVLAAVMLAASVGAFFRYEPLWGSISLALYLVLAPIAIYFATKLWIHSPLTRHLVLDGDDPTFLQEPEEAMATSEQDRRSRLAALHALVGMVGRTVTPLRPVGVVVLDGRRIDALAEFGIIDPGVEIVVVQVLDNQVKVRPAGREERRTAERSAADHLNASGDGRDGVADGSAANDRRQLRTEPGSGPGSGVV